MNSIQTGHVICYKDEIQPLRSFGEEQVYRVSPLYADSRLCCNFTEGSFLDRWGGGGIPCKSCGSVNQKKFSAEMGIHFPELRDIDKPVVWVFPEVVVCLDCGMAEFSVPKAELRQLEQSDSAASG